MTFFFAAGEGEEWTYDMLTSQFMDGNSVHSSSHSII